MRTGLPSTVTNENKIAHFIGDRTIVNSCESGTTRVCDTANTFGHPLKNVHAAMHYFMVVFLATKVRKFALALCLMLAAATFVQAQTLTTDQPDYLPGSTATITGTGFQAGETITVRVIHIGGDSLDNEISPDHQPWNVTADDSGNISTTWYVPADQDEKGATLLATADGQSSLLHAEVVFSDAAFTSAASGDWNVRSTWTAVARTGQINATTGSTTVTGNGATLFTTELVPGDIIYRSDGTTLIGTVASITNNNSLTLTAGAVNNDGNGAGSAAYSAKKIPGTADNVTIAGNTTVTVDQNSACASLSINTNDNNLTGTLAFDNNTTLSVSGAITVGGTGNRRGSINMTNGGTLQIGSTITVTNLNAFTGGAGTVEYNGGNQTVTNALGNYNNLTLSGSGTKTLSGATTASGLLKTSVTLNIGTNDLSVGSLTGSGNITNATSFSSATMTIGSDNTSPAAYTGVISNSGSNSTVNFIKTGTGILTLSGSSSYSGATTINGGTLSVNTLANSGTNSSIGTGSSTATITIAGAGTLQYTGNGNSTNRPIVASGDGATIDASGTGNVIFSGTLDDNGGNNNVVMTGIGSGTYSGNITTGSATLTKNGTGTWTLSGANTYSGGTIISGGVLSINADNNLGSGSLTFNNGATLKTTAAISMSRAITLTNNGGGTFDLGAPLTLTGTISGGGGLATSGSDLILNRASGNNAIGTINLNGGRLFVFTGLNNINGSSINIASGAILDFGITGGAAPANPMSFVSGAGLANRVGTLTISTTNATFPSAGTMIFNSDDQVTTPIIVNGNYPALTGNLDIQVGGGNTTVGTTTLNGVISGSFGTNKTSTGTLVLAGLNTYTGVTTVTAGTLKAGIATTGANGAFGNASAVSLANTSGVVLDITGFNNTIGSLTGGGTAGGNITLGAATLTIGSNNTSPAPYGGIISGTGGIAKIGSGTLTFSGVNTYTGTTTISGGILQLGAANIISNSSNFILNGGSFKTGATTGFSETVGTLQLNDNSAIALGTGAHTLTFANSSGVSWTSGKTLTITGWTGTGGSSGTSGKIIVGAAGLTAAQLASINFTGYAPGAVIISGELVPTGPPVINSTLTASTTYGTASSYQITATNSPTGYNATGLPTGISINTSTGLISVAATTTAGTYSITISATNGSGTGSNILVYTVNKRSITITADAKTKIYGDADPALTAQVTSGTVVNGDVASGALARVAGENVGTYQINKGSYSYDSNYSETYVPANLTITKRAITITADAKTKTYGGADPALTYHISNGTLAFTDAFTGSLTRDAGEDVGSYAITQGTVALSSNYTLTYVGANLTITKRAVEITADAKTKTYGDADPALTYQITNGTLAFRDNFTGSLTRDAGEDVGSYVITQGTVALSGNYTLTYVGANLTITKRAVEITADAKTKTYGDADPALTYQITNGTLAFSDAFTGSLTRDAGEDVGDYAITQGTVALSSNYTLTYVGANLTITKRAVEITADAKTKTYGDADPALTYHISNGTLAFTDAFTGSLTRDAGEDVGSYAITQGTVALSSNYTLTYVGANLTITKRAVEITADAKTKTYGDADPALTYHISNGTLAFTDAFTGSLTRDAGEDVGSYAITQGTVALSSNYTLTYVGANLTITKRAVEITADAKTKTYGDADPALTYHISNGTLAFSDAFTGSLTRDAGEDVGSYAITQGTVALSSNYTLTYVGANLTITKRAVEITADAKTKTYGDADPALTYQITNGTLAFSDNFTGSLTRDAGEDVGSYAITQGTVALSGNYTLTYVGANLTITKRAVEITADAKTKTYGDADPALTYQITNGTLAFSDNFTGSLTRDAGEDVGSYAITQGTVALSGNYTLTYVGANLTITKRAVEITADAKTKTYGDADPALTYQITNGTLAFSDNFTGSLTRDAGEDVGSYAITQGTVALSSNYTLTYVGANLTITKRAVEITADAKTKTYGDADPALTYHISNGTLAFTDAFTGSLTRDAGEDVGSYAITQGTVALSSNYTLTYVGANLTITKRAVEITADAKTKTYGDADPALTYHISNGTLAFTDAFTGSLTRDAGEDVGSYAITQGTVALSSNYTLTYVGANLTITKRAVEITADAKTKTYGDADPALTYQITNGTLAFSDNFTGSLTRDAGEDVGSYAITQGTVALSSNYTLTYVGANLTITKRAVEITADAKTKTYGDADPALTYQITNGTLAFSDNFTGSLTRDAGEDVGSYAITQGTVALSSNYTLTYVGANLTITKRAVEITADAKTKTYGDADPALTYQITNGTLAFSDNFTGSLTRDAGEDVGSYAITQGTVALSGNYTLTYVGANLTITKRAVEITADAKTKTYGDADPALTYQITNGTLAFSDAFTGSLTRDAGEDVGDYAITQGTVALSSNYTLTYVGANLTITKRAVEITADAKTKTYGDADPALTYHISNGTLAFTDAFTGSLTRDAGEDVGSYAITQGTVALSSNYTLTYVGANLTITKRAVEITADAKTKTYGDADPALTYHISNGTLAFTDAFTGSLTRDAGEDVGSYAITQGTVALSSNYTLTYVGANLTITKRAVEITADAKTKTYGDADPALTYHISNGTLAFSDAFTGSLTRDAGEDVGSYAITQGTVALSSNYTLTYVGANLTITKRAVEITADAKTKTYGDADPALTYQITNGTLAFSDNFTGSLTRDAGEDVGSYAITQGTVALSGNYTLTYVGANLTITKRAVEITADAKTKTYGDADPALTYQITNGTLAFSDNFTGSLTRDAGEDVGSYAITQGTVALSGNYTLTYVGANLTITKRAVEITADAKTKTYGDADPALTYQITNGTLAFSDNFTGSLTRDAGEDVGSYAITQGTVALSSNYTLTYVGANLTITKRAVEITADAKTKTYGDADPALTYHISNGTLAFTDAFTGSLTRDAGEDVGSYAITQGTVALSSNYTLTYVGANLTITKRAVEITADAKTKTYGDADPALTYHISNGTLAFTDAFTGSLTRDAGEDVGSYAITQGTVALSSNYTLTYVGANLTITKRAVEITADAKTKTYGDADPALTYQITNGTLVFSDNFTGSLTRDAGEDVGSYAITQGTVALSGNYTLTYVGANLTITKRAVEITADAKTKTYGDADPALTYQITNGTLAFSDNFTGSLTRDAGEDVGDYAITQGTVALSSNYTLTYVGANLTITKRAVEITADAKTKTYGDADPALTYHISNGTLAFTDAFTGSLTRDAGEDVGSYAITQGTVALSSNYTLTYVDANLTITKRAITITADAKTKVYGNANPILTAQVTSGTIVAGNVATGSLTRVSGESVGAYAISKGTYTYGSNYAENYVSANLTITQRAITITADAKTKTWGDPDPALTYKITSGTLAFTDAFSGSLTRVAGESAAGNPSNYAIQQGTVALNNNYVLSYVGAYLSIYPRAIIASASAGTIYCNGSNTTLTVIATGGDGALQYKLNSGSYQSGNTFSVAAGGPYTVTVKDADGFTKTTNSVTITQPSAVTATITPNPVNDHLYYGYSGDQTAVIKVTPSGGTGNYKISITMDRKLICNYINAAGDETWASASSGVVKDTNTVCDVTTLTGNTRSVATGIATGGYLQVTATLLDTTTLTITVTDANGCTWSTTKTIYAEDVRCFAGNSGIAKVSICHQTGSNKNPCVAICVDQSAVAEHLAHGDFLGKCTPDCKPPAQTSSTSSQVFAGTITQRGSFNVKVTNNPSFGGSEFRLKVQGEANMPVKIIVTNMYGEKVFITKGLVGDTYKFGANWRSGTYIVQVIQGNKIETLKVIKGEG